MGITLNDTEGLYEEFLAQEENSRPMRVIRKTTVVATPKGARSGRRKRNSSVTYSVTPERYEKILQMQKEVLARKGGSDEQI